MPLSNRTEAGHRIAQALIHCRELHPVVLALPRGGVPVAAEIARALEAPLELIIVRKIGVPFQPELAMGAVVDGPEPLVVRNDDIIQMARVSEADFARVRDRELAEIQRHRDRYLMNRPHTDLKDRVVIVVSRKSSTFGSHRLLLRRLRADFRRGSDRHTGGTVTWMMCIIGWQCPIATESETPNEHADFLRYHRVR